MRTVFTHLFMAAVAFMLFYACQPNRPGCDHFQGTWSDREGHNLIFLENNKGLWLNRFGQLIDTVEFVFSLDCTAKPATIDMKQFKKGPFLGKTLFGILEFSGDTLFRLCYDSGQQPDVRPTTFDPDQTMKFYR